MALPTNDDYSNRELSIEELEAIAAGFSLGGAWNWVKHEASAAVHWIEGPGLRIAVEIGKWIGSQKPPTQQL